MPDVKSQFEIDEVHIMVDDGSWGLSAAEAARAKQRPEAFGTRGMVASAHPAAACIGMAVLQRGGNAFDAAIAVAAAEGVVLPMKCGLGGDAFVVLHDAKKRETIAFNGSGVAASGATREYYASRGHKKMPFNGVHSVSVPGAVSVYEALHKRYCTMPWADLWAPAIDLAENGLAITAYISGRINADAKLLAQHKHSAAQFLRGGAAPAAGDRWNAPNLAKSLRAVQKGGADAFYRGETAEKIVAFLKSEGAPFELADFAQQQAVVYQPISSTYRGLTVYETAPPSQGFLVLEQLNILEGFELSKYEPFSAERIHLLVEAKKLAFADRNKYAGDPAFVDWPLDRLISKAHAQRRRAEIDPLKALWPQGANLPESGSDTSYFCVADGQGDAVSFIHSLSSAFGSGVVAGETGITLNNRAGRGFSLDPASPNCIAPGRRTMHTLNAWLMFRDGAPWLVGGTPGGDQQTQWSTQVITGLVDHGFTLQQAVESPRWYSFPGTDPVNIDRPPVVKFEQGIPEKSIETLAGYGHTIERLAAYSGGGAVQLIQIDAKNGVLRGASDPRPGGMALGF
ncbi:MAG TPA: gamma-glutamyltransferase [Burkholderiales bacterium]|nr:gamma-glutamyltransferase [Burkholderiales bacterium]